MFKKQLAVRVTDPIYARVDKLAEVNNMSRADVVRKALRLALRWHKRTFWERVKRCFFSF